MATKTRFEECVDFVLTVETEYNADGSVKVERDPNDPGGVTKYGIDQRDHPGVDVAHLSREGAVEIYRRENWDRCRCGDLPVPWDLLLLDSSVNPGLRWAIKTFQKVIGVTPDGYIGPKTLAAAHAAGEPEIQQFLSKRIAYYNARPDFLNGRPFKVRYIDGWLNRVAMLAVHALPKDTAVVV